MSDLDGLKPRTFEAGETIFKTGEAGTEMFLIKKGRVEIVMNGSVVEHVEHGGIFGEMTLIEKKPRSAIARATDPTEVMPINNETFLRMIKKRPEFALFVMKNLSRRIRNLNGFL